MALANQKKKKPTATNTSSAKPRTTKKAAPAAKKVAPGAKPTSAPSEKVTPARAVRKTPAGVRIRELSAELGLSSDALIRALKALNVSAKGPMTVLDEQTVTQVRQAVARSKATLAASSQRRDVRPRPAIRPFPHRPEGRPPRPAHAGPAARTSVHEPPAKAPRVVEPGPALKEPEAVKPAEMKPLQLAFPTTVKELASAMQVPPNEVIKRLMSMKIFASLTQRVDPKSAAQVASGFGFSLAPEPALEEQILKSFAPDPKKLVPRAPVVTFMGHVDHGKTSLLDAIRQSKVVEREAGGITQHIGAYEVALSKGKVTFLDTPGHEAFTALRARGAVVTDVVVLVVAADDGVMPQTVEAIDHAKAAGVPLVVAMNKIDRPEANLQKLKQQLTQYELVAEDWGGTTIMMPVSAKTGEGIKELLEMLLLEAEMLELKADPTGPAQGTVIEAELTKDRGPVATLLVEHGTLRVGDVVVVGTTSGRVRALHNDRRHRMKEALPASPVQMLGLNGVPIPGERFVVINDEKVARQLLEQRKEYKAGRAGGPPQHITLEDVHQRIAEGKLKELRFIIKADVQGSVEALMHSLEKIESGEVRSKIIHSGAGEITESDVMLAAASDAIVIGFHVGMDPRVQVKAIKEGVDVRIFRVIYEAVDAVKAAIEGLLAPKIEETYLGRAEVKQLFQVSRVGIVAGCVVTDGVIRRDATIRVIRGKDRIAEGKIANLKRHKDDAKDVVSGTECGISLEGDLDLQTGDLLEAWELKEVAQKLE